MSLNIEAATARIFPQDSGLICQRMSGGISSENYLVRSNHQNPLGVMTVLQSSTDRWKIEEAKALSKIVANKPAVLIPRIIYAGTDDCREGSQAVIVREYIEGDSIHDLLTGSSIDRPGLTELVKDLGYRLALLHECQVGRVGLLTDPSEPQNFGSWQDFVLSETKKEARMISSLPENRKIGQVSVTGIKSLLPNLTRLIEDRKESLLENGLEALCHGDTCLSNIIAKKVNGRWQITGLIDPEVMGGDPMVDFAFIENWLHFFRYKEAFYDCQESFKEGYNQVRELCVAGYPERRIIYHTWRSLSYLRTMFGFEPATLSEKSPNSEAYIKGHFDILASLEAGDTLEKLGIDSLLS